MSKRSQRLAVTQAISQLNRVDQRLLTLFWHLAERWGRMTSDGVLIPLTISHRMLSQLIGARRPTVSTALGELTRAGEVRRLDNGTWLLTGRPVGRPDDKIVRLVPPRRRFEPNEARRPATVVAAVPPPAPAPERLPLGDRGAVLTARLAALRADGSRMSTELADVVHMTTQLCQRTATMRAHRRTQREHARPIKPAELA
jgi:hypothetical protein